MTQILKVAALLILSIVLTNCSKDDDKSSISDKNLSGKVFGDSFTAVGGKAFDSGDNEVSINITNIAADCESSIFDYDLYISTDVELKVGTYNNLNVAFHKDGETTFNALGSTVIVQKITNETITVKIQAKSSTSSVEGTFTANYCK